MIILALDTSSQSASCALLEGDKLVGEFFVNAGLTHSQTAMPMVEQLLKVAKKTVRDIDLLAVSTGPGSFTGLRIGISAIKGMAYALKRPCVGVSTLEGLARNLAGFTGVILPVMDARRGQVYTASFRGGDGLVTRTGPDEAVSLEELDARIGLCREPVWLVGDGALLCNQKLGHHKNLRTAPAGLLHQRASSVALAAMDGYREGKAVDAARLAPEYLRLPQAERELLEKRGQKTEQA